MGKKFKMIDESFICSVCGKNVKKLEYTARDHCPYCLSSIHIDNNPGDRECMCHGIMHVTGFEKGKKDEIKLVYECEKCGMIKKNKMATDDDLEVLLEIMRNK